MFSALRRFDVAVVKQLPVLHTSVRYATKPRWVPMAKTKVFNIAPPVILPEDLEKESRRLKNIYRTQLKSTIEHLRKVYRENETSDEVIKKLEEEEATEWKRCMDRNDEWNKQVAIERERRNELELQSSVEMAKLKMKQIDEKRQKQREMVINLVKEQKELSKNFITEANVGEHIHKILNVDEPVTYNWAMDKNGNVYEGYSMTPNPNKRLTDMSSSNVESQKAEARS